jgi:uncharacterized protein YceK
MLKSAILITSFVCLITGCGSVKTSITSKGLSCEQAHSQCKSYCYDDTSLPGAQQQTCLDRCYETLNSCRVSPEDPFVFPKPTVGW